MSSVVARVRGFRRRVADKLLIDEIFRPKLHDAVLFSGNYRPRMLLSITFEVDVGLKTE